MAITRIGPNQSINLASNITGTLATGNGGTGATSFAPGKVLQTVQTNDVTERTTTSTSFVTASNSLSINITPSSSSNKVFIFVSLAAGNNTSGQHVYTTFHRNSTNMGTANGFVTTYQGGTGEHYGGATMGQLDSPNTTSQITYQVYFRVSGGTGKINSSATQGIIQAWEIKG